MHLDQFTQLTTDQKIMALLRSDVLSSISDKMEIRQLYSVGCLYIELRFDKLFSRFTKVCVIADTDELLPYVAHLHPMQVVFK